MSKDIFTREWIVSNATDIVSEYEDGVLTIRGLHYKLVSRGMTNTMRHYKRVVTAMIQARREGVINYEAFSDHDRVLIGETKFEVTSIESELASSKHTIEYWMKNYWKNRWENQYYYPEIFIEKKALQGVFEPICNKWDVSLSPCKGYPSLTFLNDAATRFLEAQDQGKMPIILYFGDYDPSGEDIPRSIEQNLRNDFGVDITLRRIALMESQVVEWKLPPAPAKEGDSRTAAWEGLGQVELDAVEPKKIQSLCNEAIEDIFDSDLYEDLISQEEEERELYRIELKEFINNME
jgi:hypothetical protein